MKFKPLFKNVLVKREKVEERSRGGIFLPGAAQEKSIIANVVAIGPGVEFVRVESRVVVAKYTGTEIVLDGEDCVVVKEEDIVGVVE